MIVTFDSERVKDINVEPVLTIKLLTKEDANEMMMLICEYAKRKGAEIVPVEKKFFEYNGKEIN